MSLKHLLSRKDFDPKPKSPDLSKFAEVGKKHCQGKCDRKVIMTSDGPVVACVACNRIVIDNRK